MPLCAVERGEDVPGAVLRPVVHDHELFFDGEFDGEDASDNLADGSPLVVAGHHDRQLHGE